MLEFLLEEDLIHKYLRQFFLRLLLSLVLLRAGEEGTSASRELLRRFLLLWASDISALHVELGFFLLLEWRRPLLVGHGLLLRGAPIVGLLVLLGRGCGDDGGVNSLGGVLGRVLAHVDTPVEGH